MPHDAHLLEIGPGTGQATKALAERGYRITAVELGSALADVARRELANYPKVEILTGTFEDVELPIASFDLVYVATAFHWIKPEVKFTKPHTLLKNGGHLAVIHTHHIANETDGSFFRASQPIYKKYEDESSNVSRYIKSPVKAIEDIKPEELDESLFESVFFGIFPKAVDYSANDYIKLLRTFSPTLVMRPERREGFLGEIRNLINEKFNGHVTKRYGMSLTIGKKRKQ
jgi:ubiquinone/menaquinone biosynthesis C-methylase UbiE